MKKLIITFGISLLTLGAWAQCNNTLVTVCSANLPENATYLKELKVKLKPKESGKAAPVARYSLMLSKGNHYRFYICNAKEFDGKAIIQLYDQDRLLGTSYFAKTGKHYPAFDFLCQKTAVYKVLISFEDGKEGCAVGILSLID